MNNGRSFTLFMILAISAAIYASSAFLPERVASHFSASGQADGYAPRAVYRALMVGFSLFIPCLIYALSGLLPRVLKKMLNLPNAAYWLAAERLPATLDMIEAHAAKVSLLIAAFLGLVHLAVIFANLQSPSQLDLLFFGALMGGMVASMLYMSIGFYRQFKHVPEPGTSV